MTNKVNQIVFNSFPRSANVYQGEVFKNFFKIPVSTVHIPEIFSVKGIGSVTIFRKPSDAMSSLIMKQVQPKLNINKDEIQSQCLKRSELYKEYIHYAKINKDIIYIGKFDNLINDTVKHFEDIAQYFNIILLPDYNNNFLNAKLSGWLWDDRYDGHMPRPKDAIRLDIEEKVSNIPLMRDLNKEYEDFIYEYATTVENV